MTGSSVDDYVSVETDSVIYKYENLKDIGQIGSFLIALTPTSSITSYPTLKFMVTVLDDTNSCQSVLTRYSSEDLTANTLCLARETNDSSDLYDVIYSSDLSWSSSYNSINLLGLAGSDCTSQPIIAAENEVTNENFKVEFDTGNN